MNPRLVKAAAVVSVLVLLIAGVWNQRHLFVERVDRGFIFAHASEGTGTGWTEGYPPSADGPRVRPGAIEVDAGDGVRVRVQRGEVLFIGVEARATLAKAEAYATPAGVAAHCENPTPLSRCAIWINVTVPRTTPAQGMPVIVTQRPGAEVTGTDPDATVEVTRVP